MNLDLNELSTEDILAKLADLEIELYKRKIIRSAKIVGDIGEYYAKEKYGLKDTDDKVEAGYDLVDEDGRKYQVKCRRIYDNPTRKTKNKELIQGLSKEKYDVAIIVKIGRNYNLEEIFSISRDKILPILEGTNKITTIIKLREIADNPIV
jgi:hypothetical protein